MPLEYIRACPILGRGLQACGLVTLIDLVRPCVQGHKRFVKSLMCTLYAVIYMCVLYVHRRVVRRCSSTCTYVGRRAYAVAYLHVCTYVYRICTSAGAHLHVCATGIAPRR